MNNNVEFPESGKTFTIGFSEIKVINGKDGYSPTVISEETDDGVQLTITDINGETSVIIKNGKQGPQGEQGIQGEKGDTGPQGVQGEKGETGATGAAGQKGKDGLDGYTPVKGTDYYTEAEKQELVDEISKTVTGDIDTALDNIIAIQNTLIGGDSV